ncbi:invasin domain 3-containing protein [Acidobacteriota bacterium]
MRTLIKGMTNTSAVMMLLLFTVSSAGAAEYDVLSTLETGRQPQMVVRDPGGRWIFVANNHLDPAAPGVSIYDVNSLKLIQSIDTSDVDLNFTRLEFDERTNFLYTASINGIGIYEWDSSSDTFVQRSFLPFDCQPGIPDRVLVTCSELDRRLNRLYVTKTSPDLHNFIILDLNTERLEEFTVPIMSHIWGMALDEAGGSIYLTDYEQNQVVVLRALDLTILAQIDVGAAPYDIKLVDPQGPVLYVTNSNDVTISVIQGTRVTGPPIPTGIRPVRIVVHPTETKAYVINQGFARGTGSVTVMDTSIHRPVKTVAVGRYPRAAALSGDWNRLVVCNSNSNTLTIIDTVTDLAIQKVGTDRYPFEAVFHPVGNKIYFTCRADNSLSMMTIPADPDLSIVTAVPDEIAMGGSDTSLVTVIPKDKDGNGLGPGRYVVIDATAGTLLNEVVDHQDGTYTQELQSDNLVRQWNPNSVASSVSAEVDSIRLDDEPRVTFYANLNFPMLKILEPGWGVATGGDTVRIVGNNFGSAPKVYFGGTESMCSSSTGGNLPSGSNLPTGSGSGTDELFCITPPHLPGWVDVELYNQTDFVINIDGFLYVGPGELQIACTPEKNADAVMVTWSGGSGQVMLLRSESKDFTVGLKVFKEVAQPFTDPEPLSQTAPSIYYYKLAP